MSTTVKTMASAGLIAAAALWSGAMGTAGPWLGML